MTQDATCPTCDVILEKEPKANSKCRTCGNMIYIRKKKPFFPSKLLNHEQVMVSDTFESLTASYEFSVSRKTYDIVRSALSKRFGKEASWLDVTWSIYQQLAEKFAKNGDYEQLSRVYAGQAQFLSEEGEDFSNALKESFRYRLMYISKLGARSVWVQAYGYGCTVCEKLKGKTFDIESIEDNMPLPPKGCTCRIDVKFKAGYCVCNFVAIF